MSKLGEPPPELAAYQDYELVQEMRRRRLLGQTANGVQLHERVEQLFLSSKHQAAVTTPEVLKEFWRRRAFEQHLQDLHDNPPPAFNMNFVPGLQEAVDKSYTAYCEAHPEADKPELAKAYAMLCRLEAEKLTKNKNDEK